MKVEKIKRWQWILISLIVGFSIAKARQMAGDDVVASFGETFDSPRWLEQVLLQQEKGIPHFKNLVIYPNPARTSKDRPYYIIYGKYYNGRPERQKDGTFRAVWRPACFVERDPVYRPSIDLKILNKAGGPDYVQKFKAIPKPTVLDFLKIMNEARSVNFKYAWWAEPLNATLLWMGGSVLIVGVIWPSIVYLLAFGSLTQPPQDDGIDLSQLRSVSTTPTTGPAKPTGPTQEDMDQLQQMEQQLMADLASRGDAAPAQPAPPIQGPQPIRQLTATASEVAHIEENKDNKEYAAKEDDFYPTERHRSQKPTQP